MNDKEIIIQNKRDISDILIAVRQDLCSIRTKHFDSGTVTKESWEDSPTSRVSYHKSKIPMLKAAGVMKDPKDYEFGWHFPNAYYAKVNNELLDADKQILEIIHFLKNCQIWPATRFTELELSRFEIIEGGGRDSWLLSQLKEGVRT